MYLAHRYAGMLKSHKQNLVPESEFHIREERVKAQKTDGDINSKQAPTPPSVVPEKKEEKIERDEKGRGKSPVEEKPQKVAKMKGPVTAAEAKAAEAKALAVAEEKEQEKKESKDSASEAVEAVSPSNPEPPAAAQPGTKVGGVKGKTEKNRTAENGNNHTKKTEVKMEDEKAPNGGKAVAEGVKKVQEGEDREKRSSSKERPVSVKSEDVTPKSKASNKTSVEKSDVASPKTTTTAAASPVTRGSKLGQNSPNVSQNGPTGASPSPARAGQRRQLSETEASEVVPEKGKLPSKR